MSRAKSNRAKVHWIGSTDRNGWQVTACGMWGMQVPNTDYEYDSDAGRRFEARYADWKEVTCGRCRKNPHAQKVK